MATPFPVAALLLLPTIFGLLMPASMAGNVLYANHRLNEGDALNSGPYSFTMQGDCNLVLSDTSGRRRWQSGTANRGSRCFVELQDNGDLVVSDRRGRHLWASNTGGQRGRYACILQSDGKVAVYAPALWDSQGHVKGTNGVIIADNGTLQTPGVIPADQSDVGDISMVTKE